VRKAVEGLCKSVSGHIVGTDMLQRDMPCLNAVFDVVVVDINMLSTLIVTLSVHEVNRRLVVAVQLNRLGILSEVSKLSE
jgi:hypothetical protein